MPHAQAVTLPALNDISLLRHQAYINGQWLSAEECFDVSNPANGSLIGRVPNLGAQQVQTAIVAAQQAFPAWSGKTGKERAAILRQWFDLIVPMPMIWPP